VLKPEKVPIIQYEEAPAKARAGGCWYGYDGLGGLDGGRGSSHHGVGGWRLRRVLPARCGYGDMEVAMARTVWSLLVVTAMAGGGYGEYVTQGVAMATRLWHRLREARRASRRSTDCQQSMKADAMRVAATISIVRLKMKQRHRHGRAVAGTVVPAWAAMMAAVERCGCGGTETAMARMVWTRHWRAAATVSTFCKVRLWRHGGSYGKDGVKLIGEHSIGGRRLRRV